MVKDVLILEMINIGDVLYFSGVYPHELWRSDGTEAGTLRLSEFNQGSPGVPPKHLFGMP